MELVRKAVTSVPLTDISQHSDLLDGHTYLRQAFRPSLKRVASPVTCQPLPSAGRDRLHESEAGGPWHSRGPGAPDEPPLHRKCRCACRRFAGLMPRWDRRSPHERRLLGLHTSLHTHGLTERERDSQGERGKPEGERDCQTEREESEREGERDCQKEGEERERWRERERESRGSAGRQQCTKRCETQTSTVTGTWTGAAA